MVDSEISNVDLVFNDGPLQADASDANDRDGLPIDSSPNRSQPLTLDDLVPGEITIDSALLFTGDQILYRYRDDQRIWRMKFLALAAVRAAFEELPIDSGWLPESVRRHGLHPKGNWAVMYIPPRRQTITLQMQGRLFDLTVPLPGLVFAGCGVNYFLYALKTAEFSPEADLFYAPLPNVNGNGLICFGSNQMLPCTVTTIQAMWTLCISSAFTAHHIEHRCRSYPNNIFILLRRLARKRKFPLDELLPAYMRVDQWIDRLTRQSYS